MTDASGAESPSSVGPFLIWQQPYPIFYAELVYRERGDRKTLEKVKHVVFESAEFMASYAEWDEATKRYVLGPVLQCAQEIFTKDGRWVAQYPERSKDMTGWWISQLNSSYVEPGAILKAYQENNDPTEFYNSKLGMAYIAAENRLSISDVYATTARD